MENVATKLEFTPKDFLKFTNELIEENTKKVLAKVHEEMKLVLAPIEEFLELWGLDSVYEIGEYDIPFFEIGGKIFYRPRDIYHAENGPDPRGLGQDEPRDEDIMPDKPAVAPVVWPPVWV